MNATKIIFFALIAAATIFEVAADIFLKQWTSLNRNLLLGVGLLLYFIGTIFWALSLKHETISKAISIFTVVNLIAIVLVGVLFFHEELSAANKIGIALGVVSILLIELF